VHALCMSTINAIRPLHTCCVCHGSREERLHNPACMLSQVLAPRGRFSIELYMSYLKLVGQVRGPILRSDADLAQ
jgi:hypothetical protein